MAEEEKSTKVENKVNIEDAGPCKKKFSVEIPEEKVKETFDEQYKTLAKDAQVPGFRRGRAPRRLLEKRYGKDVTNQVKLSLVAEASQSALEDNDIDALRDPDINHEEIEVPESGPLKFEFEVEVKPDFELPELKGIKVEKPKTEITDEQVEKELEQLRKWSGLWTPKKEDEKVEEEDQVIADAVLKVEDKEEDEKLDNTEIFVRKQGYVGPVPVEDLDELLIGAKVGDKKETTVEVPETYFREDYRGKKVDATIEIKDIKYLKPAEIDEEFLKRFNVDTEDELEEKVRDNLEQKVEQQQRMNMTEQIYKYLLDNTDFELPTSIVAEQSNVLLQRQFGNLMNQGLSKEEMQEKFEELKAGTEEQATDQLKTLFIMEKIADKFDIEVSDEEVNGRIAQVAMQQGQRPQQLREQMQKNGSLGQFALQVREDKCISELLEKAEIVEVEPEKESKKAKKGTKTKKKTTKKDEKKDEKKAAKKEKKETKKLKKSGKKSKKTEKKED